MQRITTPPIIYPIPTQQPSGRMYLGTNQMGIATGVPTNILLDTIDPLFTDGIEDVVNHRIEPDVAGYYIYSANVWWSDLIDQARYGLEILLGPAALTIGQTHQNQSGTGVGANISLYQHLSDVIYMPVDVWIYMRVRHIDGTNNPNILAGITSVWLSLQRVR